MNRRGFLVASSTTAALTLTAGAAQALPMVTHEGRALWSPEARAHEHASAAMAWIDRVMEERYIIAQEVWPIDTRVTLRDPRFVVEVGPAWDFMTGYRAGLTGPRIALYDGEVKVIEAELYHYDGSAFRGRVPEWSIVTRHFGDDGRVDELRRRLPGQVTYDHSRFFAAFDRTKDV